VVDQGFKQEGLTRNGRFAERETGAEYYVRELPDGTIAWVGEHAPSRGERKALCNVFLGRRTAPTRLQGDLIDVPKRQVFPDADGRFETDLQISLPDGSYILEAIQHTADGSIGQATSFLVATLDE
jgi:hypothetical protein